SGSMTRSLKSLLIAATVFAVAVGTIWALPAAAQQAEAQTEWRVVQIVIGGNAHVDESAIRPAITHTRLGQVLDVEAVTQDLQSIYDLGYFRNVLPAVQQVPATGNGVRVIFEVVELPVVEQVIVESDAVPADVVREWLNVPEGQVFNQVAWNEALGTVQDRALAECGVFLLRRGVGR